MFISCLFYSQDTLSAVSCWNIYCCCLSVVSIFDRHIIYISIFYLQSNAYWVFLLSNVKELLCTLPYLCDEGRFFAFKGYWKNLIWPQGQWHHLVAVLVCPGLAVSGSGQADVDLVWLCLRCSFFRLSTFLLISSGKFKVPSSSPVSCSPVIAVWSWLFPRGYTVLAYLMKLDIYKIQPVYM